jgi:hypothetical protein
MPAMGAGVRNRISQAPFQILMYDDQGLISTGTAFLYAFNGKRFFVTNWHNVSGKDCFTGEFISERRRAPTYLKARFCTLIEPTEAGTFTTSSHRVELYDEHRQPSWLEHPKLGSHCDIIAIPCDPLEFIPANLHVCVNEIHRIPIPVKPGVAAFVVGFPANLSVHIGWPIWKSGFIASEPHYDVTVGGDLAEIGGMTGGRTLPAFFLDAQTRRGMSGAPVFANYIGNWNMSDPYKPVDVDDPNFWNRADIAHCENRTDFVGIYSSRVPAQENEAAIGLCFKTAAIDAVCNGVAGIHPHIS